MPNRTSTERRSSLTPKELAYATAGLQLAAAIELNLNVHLAKLLGPDDLAASVGMAYAGDEIAYRITTDYKTHINELLSRIPAGVFQRIKVSPEELAARYPDLIGRGNYAQGEVTQALANSRNILPPAQAEALMRMSAAFLARAIDLDPSLVYPPNLNLSPDGTQIFARGNLLYAIAPPQVVVEYGPGIARAKTLELELRQHPLRQSILIDRNPFTATVLSMTGTLNNLDVTTGRQVVPREDGIVAATNELLRTGAGGKIDLVMMGSVETAGEADLAIGIVNARKLLRTGGLLVIQAKSEVKPGDASGSFIYQAAERTFGEKAKVYLPYTYTDPLTCQFRVAYGAVFKK